MDVCFGIGATYLVVIDTTAYAGNFEYELAAFCTGECQEHRGEPQRHRFFEFLEGHPEAGDINRKTCCVRHEEYGEVNCAVRETTEGGEPNSVAIFFKERPTPEELAIIRGRAAEYGKTHRTSVLSAPEPFEILDAYVVKIEMACTETRL